MNTLYRYLLRQFFKTYTMIFVCLVGIFIIADFVGHLSDFMDRASNDASLLNHLLVFYGARVPWFFDISGRLIALLTSVFVVAWLQRHGEMTALEAAGISRWQIIRPLFWGATLVALVAVANREWGIPLVRDQLCHNSSDGGLNRARSMTPRYDSRTNILFDGRELYPAKQQIEKLSLRLPASWPAVGRTVRAKTAKFMPAAEGRPSGYLLQGLTPSLKWDMVPSYQAADRVIIYTAKDAPWVPEEACFVISRLPVEAFQNGQRWRLYNSTRYLVTGVRSGQIESGTDVHLVIHGRVLQPFLDLSLFFLGIPFVLQSQKRHFFSSAAKTIVIGGAVTLLIAICHSLGIQGIISTSLAAWLPLIVLGPAAVLVSGPLRR